MIVASLITRAAGTSPRQLQADRKASTPRHSLNPQLGERVVELGKGGFPAVIKGIGGLALTAKPFG